MSYRSSRNPSFLKQGVAFALVSLLVNPGVTWAASGEARASSSAGAISVASDPPGANVYVDGRFAGQTPISVGHVASGDHRVRVVKEGYLENGQVVAIGTEGTKNVQVKLTRLSGSNRDAAAQVSSTGGGGGGGSKKWLWIGIAGGGAAAAAFVLANRNSPPNPGAVTIAPDTTSGVAGMAGITTFTFTSTASDPDKDPLTFNWNFGDGATGSGATPTHVYATTGTFQPTLSVNDDHSHTVNVTGIPTVTVAQAVTGTWTGGHDPSFTACGINTVLKQNGGSLTGSMVFTGPCTGTITLASGSVNPLTHPSTVTWATVPYTFTAGGKVFPGLTMSFTGTTNTAGNNMSGTIKLSQPSSGFSNTAAVVFTKF